MGGKRARRRQLISDRVALYKTEEDLGPWGAGNGRWVYDEQDKEHFVFVTISPESLPNSRARRAYKQQLEHSEGLDHPRIVSILKGGTDDGDGRPYLIQEAISGRTLEKALAAGERFKPQGALQVAIDLLNGLAYAHSRGRIEGGLSPRSVLLSGEGDLTRGRILTFGFPRVVGPEETTALGTLRVDSEYAAPEVIKNEPVDGRADVYSVAALLFRMLTGEPAIPVSGVKDAVLHRLNQTADELPAGTFEDPARDEAVRAALRRALSKAPSRRPTARGLALLLNGESDEGERFEEVLPDGGTCSASGDAIPPFAERPWDRKHSDRPFVCRTTGEVFAGQAHWDPRLLTSTKGSEKSLPEPQGEPPADVTFALPPPKPAAKKPTPEKPVEKPAEKQAEKPAEKPAAAEEAAQREAQEAEKEARSSDVVRSALIDAWEDDRRELKTARMRANRKPTESAPAPRPEPAPSALSPLSSRREAAQEEPAATPTGWALITIGLLLLALFLGVTLSGERSSRFDAERERDLAQESLSAATQTADQNASEVIELTARLGKIQGEFDANAQRAEAAEAARRLSAAALEDAQAAQARADATSAALRQDLAAASAQAAQVTSQLAALEATSAARALEAQEALRKAQVFETQLTTTSVQVQKLQEELALAKAQGAQLEQLRQTTQRLESELEQAQAREASLSQQAAAAARELAAREQSLAAAQAQARDLQTQLDALTARRADVERELSELRLAVQNGAGAPAVVETTRAALAAAPLDAQGKPAPAAGAVELTPGSRIVLTADKAQLDPLLRAGETSSAVLALHVTLAGAGKAPRAYGQTLAADGSLDPHSPRRYHRAAPGDGAQLTVWITPAEAKRYLKEGRPFAFVLEAPFGGAARAIQSAELVVTPVGGDAARLLEELRSRDW